MPLHHCYEYIPRWLKALLKIHLGRLAILNGQKKEIEGDFDLVMNISERAKSQKVEICRTNCPKQNDGGGY